MPDIRRGAIKNLSKARESSTSEGLFPKLVGDSGGSPIIKDQLPAIFHWKGHNAGEIHPDIRYAFAQYRESLAPNHRMLFDRYEIKDAAAKVVGVGSVGTGCWMMLLMAERRRSSHFAGQRGTSLGPGGLCGKEHLSQTTDNVS